MLLHGTLRVIIIAHVPADAVVGVMKLLEENILRWCWINPVWHCLRSRFQETLSTDFTFMTKATDRRKTGRRTDRQTDMIVCVRSETEEGGCTCGEVRCGAARPLALFLDCGKSKLQARRISQ